ncbi:MAG: threonine/serine dehydratase [Chloroflexota bacterium]
MQHQVEASRTAATRIAPYITTTPVQRMRQLSQYCRADVWMKQEYLQHTGSFKLRGALNAVLSLNPTQRARGVVAASSGNHGAAVAYACQIAGCRATIFVPEHAAPVKIAAMRELGAEVRLVGNDSVISEAAAREYATTHNLPYVSPYNDEVIMAGQGTLALEIIKQIPMLNTVIIAVGGGGLIGGMAAVLKAHHPQMIVIGAQPIHSAVMVESVREGTVVDIPSDDTISDGTAGGIESDTVTFTNYKRYVDMTVLVSEREIVHSMRDYINRQHHLIEGAAGVALAATTKLGTFLQGRVVAVIGCGAGIGVERLCGVMQEHR